ncbi:MAG TPA: hypothetical protein VK604_15125 [Bryobacteraceae bacterium]|nr:hypothetical protein [Bryobacteraceae bacterium]
MADAKSTTLEISPKPALRRSEGSLVRSSAFKYYIHDSVNACRLELLGELSEKDLAEMSGCWQTAKTTLGARQLILDLRRLHGADAASSRWLANMAADGATYLPTSYLTDVSEKQAAENGIASSRAFRNGKLSKFARILGLLRGACIAGAD